MYHNLSFLFSEVENQQHSQFTKTHKVCKDWMLRTLEKVDQLWHDNMTIDETIAIQVEIKELTINKYGLLQDVLLLGDSIRNNVLEEYVMEKEKEILGIWRQLCSKIEVLTALTANYQYQIIRELTSDITNYLINTRATLETMIEPCKLNEVKSMIYELEYLNDVYGKKLDTLKSISPKLKATNESLADEIDESVKESDNNWSLLKELFNQKREYLKQWLDYAIFKIEAQAFEINCFDYEELQDTSSSTVKKHFCLKYV